MFLLCRAVEYFQCEQTLEVLALTGDDTGDVVYSCFDLGEYGAETVVLHHRTFFL